MNNHIDGGDDTPPPHQFSPIGLVQDPALHPPTHVQTVSIGAGRPQYQLNLFKKLSRECL